MQKTLLKQLAYSNPDIYKYKLKWYLKELERLQYSAKRLAKEIDDLAELEKLTLTKRQQASWEKKVTDTEKANYLRYVAATTLIKNSASEAKKRGKQSELEKIMKDSYRLIDQLREEITGQKTTFRIAFTMDRKKTSSVYEMELPLDEILNVARLEGVAGGSAGSSMKLRLSGATKAVRQRWQKQAINISDSYRNFQNQTDLMGLTFQNTGRQYEFYRKSQHLNKINNTVLERLSYTMPRDTISFAQGVDFAYQDSAGKSHYESLKSFVGKDPSLASLSTILDTFNLAITTIRQMQDPLVIQQRLEEQLNKQGSGIEEFLQKEIKDAIPSQIIQPALQEIFKPEQALSSINFTELFT